MAETQENIQRKMPRGVRKGGVRYPRYTLEEALVWSKKLVSKTHLGPQKKDVILAGVVGAKSSAGEIRVSSLKQYGLLEGPSTAYKASDLAKKISSAPQEDLKPLYGAAALCPGIFKSLFETFHGDEISKAKLRQRAAELQIHPEETEKCIDIYVSALETAGLVSTDGDKIFHQPPPEIHGSRRKPKDVLDVDSAEPAAGIVDDDLAEASDAETTEVRPRAQRAVFNVNVTLDSSLDIEKLSKQLELLKRFGAI